VVDELIDVNTGARLHYRRVGGGEPLLLVMGTAASLGRWMQVERTLADHFDVVSFDYRGLGDSKRGDGPMTLALTGEHDIVIPPRHGRQVAEASPERPSSS
jgi:pimeloyl-ACP methyl ester carboxylesterase